MVRGLGEQGLCEAEVRSRSRVGHLKLPVHLVGIILGLYRVI